MFSPGLRQSACLFLLLLGVSGPAQTPPADPADTEAAPADDIRPVETWLEAQVELARRGFSGGSIDGIRGPQSVAALRAFQRGAGLKENGELDQATRESLLLTAPALAQHTFSVDELPRFHPVPATWLGKSGETILYFATPLEAAAEQGLEQALRRRRLDGPREAKRQCGEQNAARATGRTAICKGHFGLPTPGTNSRGGVLPTRHCENSCRALLVPAATGWA